MAVKLRLTRIGNKKRAFYRIVASNSTTRRDGRPLAFLGWYNPVANPAEIKLDMAQVQSWLDKGAEATDTVQALIKKAKASA